MMKKLTIILVFLVGITLPVAPWPVSAAQKIKTPENAEGKPDEIPDWVARWELARTLTYAKRYPEALTEYKKLIAQKPGLIKPRLEMAKILFWQNRHKEAFAVLEALDPSKLDSDSLLLMADLSRSLKTYGKAAAFYQEYLRKKPDDNAARLRYADMLSWEKKYDDSLAVQNHPCIDA